jgi:SAM-dependent methyltransferase
MPFSPKALIYKALIDPILAKLHSTILEHVKPTQRVLDIACGTGALAMAMAKKAGQVTGIDLSDELITAARQTARRRGASNATFEVRNAADLTCYADHSFDIAVTSMAIHQFEAGLALKILAEMKRIALRLILVDYNHHMPRGWGRSIVWGIEALAGGDHYRNFRTYMQLGGMPYFTRQAGLKIRSEVLRGGGVFVVAKCLGEHE